MDPVKLTEKFKETTGKSPKAGDTLPYEDHLYQVRSGPNNTILMWVEVCLLVQEDTKEDDEVFFLQFGDTHVEATLPNLVGLIMELHKHDPNSKIDDAAEAVINLFKEDGWNKEENKSMGTVTSYDVNGGSLLHEVRNASLVIGQLEDGNGIIKLDIGRDDGSFKFINVHHYKSIEVSVHGN